MWKFEITFEDQVTCRTRMDTIEVDEQFCTNKREVYYTAMAKALNEQKENELLTKLEFISC